MPAAKKMPLNKSDNTQRGQILPLGLAFLLCTVMGVLLFVNLGRMLVARERHRMQVDLTAHAGAVDMARCLNISAALNKAQVGIFVALAFLTSPLGAFAVHVTGSKFIDAGVKVAAFLPEATVLYVGYQNGLLPAVPVWSHGIDGVPGALPTLNLQRRYASGGILSALAEFFNWDKGDKIPEASPKAGNRKRYTYKSKKDGKEIEVDSSQVEKILIRDKKGHTRSQARRRDPISGKVKFVKESDLQDPYPLDLVEIGPHRVTVIGWADNAELFNSRLFPRPPKQFVIASAEAGGGDVKMLALAPNADFDAYLIPVQRGLHLGDKFEKVLQISQYLRRFGVSLPEEVQGWALIEH